MKKTELQQRIFKFEFKKSEFPKENVEDKFLIFENEFWSDFQKLDFKRWFSNVNFQKYRISKSEFQKVNLEM